MNDPNPARVLVADPPWKFGDNLPGKGRGARPTARAALARTRNPLTGRTVMDEKALEAAAIAVRDVFIHSGAAPYRMAEAAITAYLEASGEAWQPMETAPRDGAWIEAYRKHATRPVDVKFDPAYGEFEDGHGNHVYHLVAWRHLIPPPAIALEGK